MQFYTYYVKRFALSILGRSKVRGHDVWMDARYFHNKLYPKDRGLVFFDVGANIGQTALSMAQTFPQAKVYSFEPSSTTYSHLLRNVSSYPNIKAIHGALGDVDGECILPIQSYSLINSFIRTASDIGQYENVPMRTIDMFCADNGIGNIFFLKIDTEGYDIKVLKGAKNLLIAHKVDYILVETRFLLLSELPQSDFMSVAAFLHDFGYNVVHFYEHFYASPGGQTMFCNSLFTFR